MHKLGCCGSEQPLMKAADKSVYIKPYLNEKASKLLSKSKSVPCEGSLDIKRPGRVVSS